MSKSIKRYSSEELTIEMVKQARYYVDALSAEIEHIEYQMETVRNKRQEFQTMFENFDQKASQLFNILSTVVKSIKEMSSAATRNIL